MAAPTKPPIVSASNPMANLLVGAKVARDVDLQRSPNRLIVRGAISTGDRVMENSFVAGLDVYSRIGALELGGVAPPLTDSFLERVAGICAATPTSNMQCGFPLTIHGRQGCV